ncbi:hypothetical protein [uncultured Cytophaga sp.]|uniref:hypothetical protein n=1 Tax=uncultured Cytophaga sp. TaxID=160238 RepID=UPI0026201A90|nr:hypothetical protein [uncultured Cytophaga sp.]
MTYKNSIIILFCFICISTFGQELQSPQISQNAIFANPGLAGSKGETRISTALLAYKWKRQYSDNADNNGYNYTSISKRNVYNGLISIDGLILKNKLGIAGYLKNESLNCTDIYNSYQYNSLTNARHITYQYTNINMGFMIAPKFQITARNNKKQDHVLSPAFSIGFKETQSEYTGPTIYTYHHQDSTVSGKQKSSFGLDYVSASLLYSSPNSYTGIKLNFGNYANNFILYDVSFLYAKTYSNKKIAEPKFSFTHQFQFTFPTFALHENAVYYSYYDRINRDVLTNYFNANLDFRYDKFILGTFAGFNGYYGVYGGFTGGIQLEKMKIIVNYSPRFSPKDHGSSGLFLSANFYLKGKKERYK